MSRLLALTKKVEAHDKEIAEIRQELRDLTAIVHRLAFEIQRISERENHEREKIQLRLENQMLSFERRLPPAKPPEEDKEMD